MAGSKLTPEPPSKFVAFLVNFHNRHESIKNYIHNGFRYPLPRWGRVVMGFVYFCTPVIGGWYLVQWSISKSHEIIGKDGEKLAGRKLVGSGNERGDGRKVGAGGWGGGTALVSSDEETQRKNLKKLKKFLKRLKKVQEEKSVNNNLHEK